MSLREWQKNGGWRKGKEWCRLACGWHFKHGNRTAPAVAASIQELSRGAESCEWQACHFFKNSQNSEGAGFDFRDCFNLFRDSISFQAKQNSIKIGWLDQKLWKKMCKNTWKTYVLLHPTLLSNFSLLFSNINTLLISLLPFFQRGMPLDPLY